MRLTPEEIKELVPLRDNFGATRSEATLELLRAWVDIGAEAQLAKLGEGDIRELSYNEILEWAIAHGYCEADLNPPGLWTGGIYKIAQMEADQKVLNAQVEEAKKQGYDKGVEDMRRVTSTG